MFRRIFALIIAIILFALVVAAFILGVNGSQYFIAMLYLIILVSVIFYAIALMTKVFRNRGEELAEEAKARNEAEDVDAQADAQE